MDVLIYISTKKNQKERVMHMFFPYNNYYYFWKVGNTI
jgi:hypothetical protein